MSFYLHHRSHNCGLWELQFMWLSIILTLSLTIRSTALGSTLCQLPQMLLWTTMLHYPVAWSRSLGSER